VAGERRREEEVAAVGGKKKKKKKKWRRGVGWRCRWGKEQEIIVRHVIVEQR
jgi:hypothetical protein